jgi:restriction modification system DNA specificity domain protein
MNKFKQIELDNIIELRKEKYNPLESDTNKPCIELEHFDQGTGQINGYIPSLEQKSIKNIFYKGDVLFGKLRPYLKKYWLAEFDGVCSSEAWVLKPKNNNIITKKIFILLSSVGAFYKNSKHFIRFKDASCRLELYFRISFLHSSIRRARKDS